MRLHAIHLKNFRSFGDEAGAGIEIPLARINYLIGPNGAGKSNALAGLKRLARILVGGEYKPGPSDYFDNETNLTMELGATMELSKDERLRILNQSANKPPGVEQGKPPIRSMFSFVKYSVAFVNGEKHAEKLSATVWDGSFKTFSEAYKKGSDCVVSLRKLRMINLESMSVPDLSSSANQRLPSTNDIIGWVSPSLSEDIKMYFSGLRDLGIGRKIAAAVPAREAKGVSSDGGNLPAEMNGLDRDGQYEFDKHMNEITHGDPESIETDLRGSELVLQMKEDGLKRRGTHADLGSGQEQSLILCWQLRNLPKTLFIIREPELHLHPERQKQIRLQIQRADPSLQFIIETHSPIFLGTGNDENVLLAKKSEGCTHVARIAPESMYVIREELGISHADALYNTRVLFVEGKSEFVAFPVFWKALRPDLGPVPSLFSLDGAGNTKHLRLILEYLKDDDRRFFVILDRHDDAVSHTKNLPPALLPSDSLRILKKSFEDEFTGDQISRAANNLAKKAGLDLWLTSEELDAAGRGGGMIKVVKRRWFEVAATPLNKADLAAELARLCGREIPAGIRAALEAAAASLGRPDPAGSESKPTAASGGLT